MKVSDTYIEIEDAYNSGRYRQIVAYGGSRSGKSYSIMQLFALILLTRRNFKITCWRNVKADAIATVLEDFKNITESDPDFVNEFVHNKKDATFYCRRTNSMILFVGTEKLSKVLGLRQDISYFNEISEFNEDVYNQITQRTTETIFVDYNPSRTFFIDKYRGHDDTIFLWSNYEKNLPFLTEGIINKLESYNPFEAGSTYVENDTLMYEGEPVSNENMPPPNERNIANKTADRYMYEVYCLGLRSEKPNRIYKGWGVIGVEAFYSLDTKSYYGLDFGISKPTAIVEVKYDGDRTFYVRQRMYRPSQTIGVPLSEFIKHRLKPSISSSDVIVCDSAKETMVQDLRNDGLMAIGAVKGPGSVSRRITTLQGFTILYTDDSLDLEEEYYNYVFKKDRYGLVTDEIDPRSEDHLMDAMGYIIDYLVRYLNIKTT